MSSHDPFPAPILVLCRDLIFASRITAAARAEHVVVQILRDPQQLAQHRSATKLIVDLNQQGALDAATEWKSKGGGSVIGFVSHVDAPTIARARELGLDHILPRSAFVQQLPTLLKTA